MRGANFGGPTWHRDQRLLAHCLSTCLTLRGDRAAAITSGLSTKKPWSGGQKHVNSASRN